MAPTSLNDLNNEATIDGDLVAILAYESCEEIVAQANKVREDGIDKLNAGEKIEAYVLLKRSTNLADILEMAEGNDVFLQSQDGQAFVEAIEIVKAQLLVLAEEVERLIYDTLYANMINTGINSGNGESQTEPVIKGPYDLEEGDEFFKTIEPLEFVTLAKEKNRILLVDFRADTSVSVDLSNSDHFPNTTVALCHPAFITPHLPLVYLSRVLPENERPKFLPEVITGYDYVVLMNDEDPEYDDENVLVPPALDLVKALTEYASIHKLKREPIFLKGGFNKWRQDCGIYVSEKVEAEIAQIMDIDQVSIDQATSNSKSVQFSSLVLEFTRHNDVIVRADDSYTGSVVFPAYISFKEAVPIVAPNQSGIRRLRHSHAHLPRLQSRTTQPRLGLQDFLQRRRHRRCSRWRIYYDPVYLVCHCFEVRCLLGSKALHQAARLRQCQAAGGHCGLRRGPTSFVLPLEL